jgi:hypothetical protein
MTLEFIAPTAPFPRQLTNMDRVNSGMTASKPAISCLINFVLIVEKVSFVHLPDLDTL